MPVLLFSTFIAVETELPGAIEVQPVFTLDGPSLKIGSRIFGSRKNVLWHSAVGIVVVSKPCVGRALAQSGEREKLLRVKQIEWLGKNGNSVQCAAFGDSDGASSVTQGLVAGA